MKACAKWYVLLLSLFALGQLAAAAEAARGTFTRDLKVSGPVDLSVHTGSGNITVRSGETAGVHVLATIHARESWTGGMSAEEKVRKIQQNPPIVQNGNTIDIGRISDEELRRNVSIDYEVTVPPDTQLEAESGSGDQVITGLERAVEAGTGSGNIHLTRIGERARTHAGSGDITLEEVRGDVEARTGSGNVIAKSISGGLDAQTGSGDVTLEQVAKGDVSARTGSGNVKLQGVQGGLKAHTGSGDVYAEGEPIGGWEIETGSGNVRVSVPSTASFDLDARSSSGEVTVNRPITIQGTMKRNRIEGKAGNGGMLLTLRTGSGDIVIN